LFGGTAQNLKAKVDAFLSAQTTSFKNYEDYVFDDPTCAFNTQTQTVFDGKLSANGVAMLMPILMWKNRHRDSYGLISW
jgi:hypothetical protein